MRRVIGEGLSQLLDHPPSRGMAGDVEVEDTPSPVVEDEPDVEEREAHGRDDEEVHSRDHVPVIPQESHPPLMRVPAGIDLRQVSGDRCQSEVNSEFRQLGLDLSSTPAVLGCHPIDQDLRFFWNRRPTGSWLGDPSPVAAERPAVPADDRLRPNHHESASPTGPIPGEGDPKGSVQRREPQPRMAMDVDGQLLAKRKLDDGLVLSTPEEGDCAAQHRSDESEQRPEHHPILLAAGAEREPESRETVGLSSTDERDRDVRKRERNQCGRIMGTDTAKLRSIARTNIENRQLLRCQFTLHQGRDSSEAPGDDENEKARESR